eukprot:jgi/Undpi1/12256/HiC_scaffold_5.g01932.m1
MVRLVEGRIVSDDEAAGSEGVLNCAMSTRINLFGFRVPLGVACAIAAFALLRFGLPGLGFVVMVAAVSYFAFNDGGSGGSGGGSSGGRSRREGLGRNVRGMDDIPKPPPSS